MFFTKYDVMSAEEVSLKLAEKPKADGSVQTSIIGKHFRVILEGEFAPSELKYNIIDDDTLSVVENGCNYTIQYSASSIGRIILLTHRVPDSDRGWHLVIDTNGYAVTAFETWFGIEVPVGYSLDKTRPATHTRMIYREVERQCYFGWIDMGDGNRPESTHTKTNRIEGRGLHWDYSFGHQQLTFFPSVASCVLVELGDAMGDITMTNPADYVRIDDQFYIFARWEVEFGGKMWIEIMDFFDKEAIGLEFGFDSRNELAYRLHSAKLTITGDAAHMESIADYGVNGTPLTNLTQSKGQRYSYRPTDIDIPMTKKEARECAKQNTHIFESGGNNIMASGNGLPKNYFLVGKQFKVKLDGELHAVAPWTGKNGAVYEYDFISKEKLRFRIGTGEWHEEKYICFEPAKDIYFFSHMITGDPDYTNITQAIDFSTGLTTTVRAQIGNWHSEWETGSCAKFGILEYGDIVPPFARRHHFSNDLIGECYAYAYRPTMNSIHIYTAPESYSWTIVQSDNSGGASWSSPGYIIKLRNDAYILEWVEENCNGMQGLVIINPEILHDGGFFFGVGHNGLSLNTTGAFMRKIGSYDIAKYFSK